MIPTQLKELLLQSLEHEKGGVLVYETALECVLNENLSNVWEEYLEQTKNHVAVLTSVCERLGLDPGEKTPGRQIVQHTGKALVQAMKMALAASNPAAAQLVACECVVLAETKDHLDWKLIGKCADELDGETAEILRAAYEEIEYEEDEHLYHTTGWCRELWLESLGLTATLPPPEEEWDVSSAAEAEDAQKADESRRRSARAEPRAS